MFLSPQIQSLGLCLLWLRQQGNSVFRITLYASFSFLIHLSYLSGKVLRKQLIEIHLFIQEKEVSRCHTSKQMLLFDGRENVSPLHSMTAPMNPLKNKHLVMTEQRKECWREIIKDLRSLSETRNITVAWCQIFSFLSLAVHFLTTKGYILLDCWSQRVKR